MYFNYCWRSYARIRWYNTDCRKIIFNQFYRAYKKVFLSLHYKGSNIYLFVNGIKIIKFKAKESEIKTTPFCLGNFSKNFSLDNMKTNECYEYAYDKTWYRIN